MPIKCFMLDPTERTRRTLRRYVSSSACPMNPLGYHNAETPIEDSTVVHLPNDCWRSNDDDIKDEDPRWPTHCLCGYEFVRTDSRQVFSLRIHTRRDDGQEYVPRGLPAGAMWYSDWRLPWDAGPDGHSLSVQTPGGEWCVDSRASNCTMPDDDKHKCWVRHGDVPNITVDKNGLTCAAGAGSIQCGSYHGFLRDGHLTD